MKKNERGSFLVTLWWLIGCLCLGVLLLLLAPRESRPSETENRMLAGVPTLTKETLANGEYFSGIEDYLSDGFFARSAVVEATQNLLETFNRQTENQRQMEQEAKTNALLMEDAGGEDWDAFDEEAVAAWAEEPESEPPMAEVTFVPTAVPTAQPTPVPTAQPTMPAASVSAAQPTITPTATPKVITPLDEKTSYRLELVIDETKADKMYEYSAKNVMVVAQNLNFLKSLLPEGGEVHYMQIPVAEVGRRVSIRKSDYIGWRSTVEDALATQVVDGVHVYNIPAILNDHLAAKEDIFYYTDHHWTPLGAWYAMEAVCQQRGYPVIPFEEYEYESRIMRRDKVGREDWLHFLHPLLPTHSYILTKKTNETEIPFMNYKAYSYTGYINNTRTPWRKFTGGYGSQRKALMICDSFGNVFLPYLLPYYGEVDMTDLRAKYFKESDAGGAFAELLAYHEIDDIYVVLSTSNGINSPNSLQVMWNTITRGVSHEE